MYILQLQITEPFMATKPAGNFHVCISIAKYHHYTYPKGQKLLKSGQDHVGQKRRSREEENINKQKSLFFFNILTKEHIPLPPPNDM